MKFGEMNLINYMRGYLVKLVLFQTDRKIILNIDLCGLGSSRGVFHVKPLRNSQNPGSRILAIHVEQVVKLAQKQS